MPFDPRRLYRLDRLGGIERRAVWQAIQRKNPALADLLLNDQFFQQIKQAFAASVVLSGAELNRYLEP